MPRHLPVLLPLSVFGVLVLAIVLLGPKMLASLAAPAPPAHAVPASASISVGTRVSSSSTPTASDPTKRAVLAYYVPYDETSWASFQSQAAVLNYVDAQWVTVDACGNLGSRDDRTLIAYADEKKVKVLPSLLVSSSWLDHRLLTDPATSDRFASEIVRYVLELDYPGFDLDMEGIDSGDRGAYSTFVAKLAGALHSQGKILTLAIPAKTSDVRTGWAGPYDYAALGRYADLILLMSYDYSWSSGPPGSIAPQEWVDRVAAYAATQIPHAKILIGIAFYGYDWNMTQGGRARALLYPQAAALAEQHGTRIVTDEISRSGRFTYTARAGDAVPLPPSTPAVRHDITVRTPGQCVAQSPSPTPTPTPRPKPPATQLQDHVVWLEDAASAAGRLQIAVQHDLGGIGAWRLGQEDPGVWPRLAAYRSGN